MKGRKISMFAMSLRAKILSILVVMGVTTTGVTAYEMWVAAEEAEELAMFQFKGYAREIASKISAQFYERYSDVQAFAMNPVLLGRDERGITSALDSYAVMYGIYDVILFVDTNGRYVASNGKAPDGRRIRSDLLRDRDYSSTAWFQAAISGSFTEDKERGYTGTFFEDAHIDPVASLAYEQKSFGTSFTTLVRDSNGAAVGVLTNRANFSWVEGEFRQMNSILVELHMGSSEFTLLNRRGEVILDYDPDERVGTEVKRDFDVLLKLNLAEKGVEAAKSLVAGKSGSGVSVHARKNIPQVIGYEFINEQKWIPAIGWGVMVRESEDELMGHVDRMRTNFYLWTGVVLTLIFGFSWWAVNRLAKDFISVSDKLREAAELTTETAGRLADSAQTVSESSAEQAAAVQETVSSMSEISSMITQTTQNVRECGGIAADVSAKTEQGNQVMRRLAAAIESANHANAQLQSMASIINEVSGKTMVINDIVFKTQLLSINASIEAARAGQHGKGFSVVAEEVGNLAQMSGNAAKEIQLLLADSQKQASQIIEVTQARSRESQEVSNEAIAAFSDIAAGIQAINERLRSVDQATREQELGIKQISSAMDQMDQTTQRNSTVSAETSSFAKTLGSQSERTYRVMRAIRSLVLGRDEVRKARPMDLDIVDRLLGTTTAEAADVPVQTNEAMPDEVAATANGARLDALASRIAARTPVEPGPRRKGPETEPELSADSPEFRRSA
jgi:uncharacterized coiled-coil DUF342 family protein